MTPFQLAEVTDQRALWTRGGFPRFFLASSEAASIRWREVYMQTYVEESFPLSEHISVLALKDCRLAVAKIMEAA